MSKIKNILLGLLLVILTIPSVAQYKFDFSYQTGYNWKKSSEAFCGVGSVWCGVFRSPYKNAYNYYEYYVWFQSNSYFSNCNFSRTYLENIDILYYDEYYKSYYRISDYSKFSWTVGNQTLYYTLYNTNPYLILRVNMDKIEPTIY